MMDVTEGPSEALCLSTRTAIIQHGPLVDRVSVDCITHAPSLFDDSKSHKYADPPSDLAAKNVDGEAWLVNRLLIHRRKRNGALDVLVPWVGDYEQTWEPLSNILE